MNTFLEANESNFIDNIRDLISIPSVAREPEGEEYPFGKPAAEALNYVLQLAEDMGLKCKNYDNYAGEISLGEGPHMIGILCHADVVDAGEGWDTDPFSGVIKDGEIYGRGMIDNKGPLISCLYGMKYIKERKLLPPGNTLKMIIGTDEEENWDSIAYYLSKEPILPDISIVPDASFPVISCEKGLMNFELLLKDVPCHLSETVYIDELLGGERTNVVPAEAACFLKSDAKGYDFNEEIAAIEKLSQKYNIAVEICQIEQSIKVKVRGRAAHAMTPEKGINAISHLMKVLTAIKFKDGSLNSMLRFYDKYIGLDYDGSGFGCNVQDEASGDLTVNIGIAEFRENKFRCSVNLRYPVTYGFRDIEKRIVTAMKKENAQLKWGVCMDPIYFEESSEILRSLMEVYQEETGDYKSKPIAIGGATYARAISNAVAFGPVFPEQEELAHEPNEHYSIADIKCITKIYVKALLKLCK